MSYGPKVEATRKPYAFVGFGALFFYPIWIPGPPLTYVLRYIYVKDS